MRAVICFQSAIRELLYRIVAATKAGYQCARVLFTALCRTSDWAVAGCENFQARNGLYFLVSSTGQARRLGSGGQYSRVQPNGETMARLRDLIRTSTAGVLSFGLTLMCVSNGSISHASTVAFGTVVSADRARVGSANATVGTTVLSGDTLDTDKFGSLQVRAGAARLLLSSQSQVTWANQEGGASATLKNGTAIFSTANAKAFSLHAGTALIRPNTDAATVGSAGDWVVARPFGTELVVLLITPAPLFSAPRPEREARADYLRALDAGLKQMAGKYGPDRIMADVAELNSRARKH